MGIPAKNLKLDGVVRSTNHALQSEPVIFGSALCTAVVAEHDSLGILKLLWHWLALDGDIEIAELGLHISEGLVADRAFVRCLLMFRIALSVDTMATRHENEGLWRGEHILAADGTIAIRRTLYAFMGP